MFWKDHAPPHIYASYEEYEVIIDIRTFEIIKGKIPNKALNLILEWSYKHRSELLENWELCKKKSNTKKNITPKITCTIPWRVNKVIPLANYKLEVEFIDGTHGFVDMEKQVKNKNAGVFKKLRNVEIFNKVHIYYGAVTWPGEIDLAPDAIYEEIKNKGTWII